MQIRGNAGQKPYAGKKTRVNSTAVSSTLSDVYRSFDLIGSWKIWRLLIGIGFAERAF